MMKVVRMMIKLVLVIATVIDYLFFVVVLYLLLSLHTIEQHNTEL